MCNIWQVIVKKKVNKNSQKEIHLVDIKTLWHYHTDSIEERTHQQQRLYIQKKILICIKI